MNVAAAIDARSIAARFDVSIIWINPYRFRRKPPLQPTRKSQCIGREILGGIIFAFRLRCKPIM